MEVVADGRLSV